MKEAAEACGIEPPADYSAESLKKLLDDSLDKVITKGAEILTDGICDLDKLKEFISDKVGEVLLEKLEKAIEAGGKALTNAALDTILAHLNREYTIKGDITAHRFTTQAIAGAGGKETSVAGSVAIAVINGDTEALIAGAGDPSSNVVAVSRDMTVRALGSQVENTTASAAEDSRGKADANMGAGAGDKTEGSDEPATKASKIDTISNAVIQVGAGGSATTNERKVTLKPDEGRKLRSVSVKYTKPDGSTATMELPMNGGNTFTVPEISKSGSSCTITLGGQEIKVKS